MSQLLRALCHISADPSFIEVEAQAQAAAMAAMAVATATVAAAPAKGLAGDSGRGADGALLTAGRLDTASRLLMRLLALHRPNAR